MLIIIFIYINFLPCGLHFTPFPSLREGGKFKTRFKTRARFLHTLLDVGGAGARSSLLAVLIIIIVILSLSHLTNQ